MILAHTVPVCLARVPVTINQDMKGLRPKGGITAEFLQWALLAQHRSLLRLVSTAAHGTRKLDIDTLETLKIPVPPQSKRSLITKWTDTVRDQQSAARQRAVCQTLIDQTWRTLLYRAFTGELTAKWREAHEAHLVELLAEMEQQAKVLNLPKNVRN
jgi:type I restriction enzyme S subunit